MQEGHRNVGGGIYAVLFFGIALIVAAVALPILGLEAKVGVGAIFAMIAFGLLLSLLSTGLIVVAKLYVRTRASEAFVKTGKGGMVVVQNGGAIVIPMIHEILRVSLETMVLPVKREGGQDALITKDKLRADIEAQFYLCVKPKDEDIQAAARSLGSKMGNESAVRELVEDKLISALRNAAATRTLEELNSDRESFTRAVEESIKADLAHNGLTLETVTISRLDQTDPAKLKPDNIFDAQGLRTIAEITQRARTERNLLERAGEREREQQDVETQQKLLGLRQQQAEAVARQAAEIAGIKAAQDRAAKEKEIDRDRAVAIATAQKEQAVAVATQEKEQAVAVATQAKDKDEIAIYEIRDIDSGDELAWVARGTHDQTAFAEAIRRYEADPDLDLDPAKVTHETWRSVPARDELGYRVTRSIAARPGSPGAYAVTAYSRKEWER